MALDAAMLSVTAKELKQQLVGARVEKIHMPTRDEVLFLLRTPDGPKKLLASARSGSARVHITAEAFDNPATPPSFCMLLRKYLASGRITDVRTQDGERILFIDFEALNEMGDRVELTASLEMMGRYSNIVLINAGGHIIDALKRIDMEQSDKRQLLPGLAFTMPPKQDKLQFLNSAAAMVAHVVKSSKPLSAALLDNVAGIGPVVCREIACRVDRADPDADKLNAQQTEKLDAVLSYVRNAANGNGTVFSIVYDGEKPVEYSFIPLEQYHGFRMVSFQTASELFDCYYSEKDRAERAKSRSYDLSKQVNALLERVERKHTARLQEQKNTEKAEQKKLFGELVNANLHRLQKGMQEAQLVNYYTGELLTVPLDQTKTPVQNAQRYYKDYKKLTTAALMLEQFLQNDVAEMAYLKSVQYEITQATTEEDFLLIRKELKEAGYLRGFKYKDVKGGRKTSGILKYRTTDGLQILAGRNNAANDNLTLKTADKNDVWFHVKDAAGSHVVLKTEQSEPSDRDYTEAAAIAAFHSAQRAGQNIAVDYTRVKNVKKAPGQRAGMVVYDHFNTAYVTPSIDLITRLKAD